MLKQAQLSDLPKIIDCHIASFPKNLHSKLGKSFIAKSFLPFVNDEDKHLMFIEVDGVCAGFFSALPVGGEFGSASTMIQSAFTQGIVAMATRPWLVFHPEVIKKFPLIWRNVRVKILKRLGKRPPSRKQAIGATHRKELGLAGIGVHPDYRKGGYAIELIKGAENLARDLGYETIQGVVSVHNDRSYKLYQLLGWKLTKHSESAYGVTKEIVSKGVVVPGKMNKSLQPLSH